MQSYKSCHAQESLKTVASSLGFKKVTALLSALPAICNYTWPSSTVPIQKDGLSFGMEVHVNGLGKSNDGEVSDKPAARKHQKRIYRPLPGAAKAARIAAEKLRQKRLWQQVCVRPRAHSRAGYSWAARVGWMLCWLTLQGRVAGQPDHGPNRAAVSCGACCEGTGR